MNLGGVSNPTYHVYGTHKDTETTNAILVTPTGKSGRLYDGEQKADLLELSVHLPAVGNMIDTGYDLIYGSNSETGQR
jgi:hypothetical protein